MEQYISKSAVVAEIEKRIKTLDKILSRRPISWPTLEKLIEENKKVLSFINTLEEKDVDLEKEIDKIYDAIPGKREDIEYIASHFFELGLKAKGE